MLELKKKLASSLAEAAAKAFSENAPGEDEIAAMLEYPPDDTLGDIALPCFKLSKTLRQAPPKIASALAEASQGIPGFDRIAADGGYLNFKVSGEHLVLKAQALGLNTCWVAMTFKKSACKRNCRIEKVRSCCAFSLSATALRRAFPIKTARRKKLRPRFRPRPIGFGTGRRRLCSRLPPSIRRSFAWKQKGTRYE